ncbi:MAG: sugar transferase [Pseudomonadota bacterium]
MRYGAGVVFFDCIILLVACGLALLLRDNFEPDLGRAENLLPLLAATAASAIVVFSISGTASPDWRFTALNDYLRITVASAIVIGCAAGLVYQYNQFEGIARSIPVIQFVLGTGLLVASRVLARLRHSASNSRRVRQRVLSVLDESELRSSRALIVGQNRLAEAYLHAMREFSSQSVRVEGVLPLDGRGQGRAFMGYDVLGAPENIDQILANLEVHGISIDRILLACRLSSLSEDARGSLLALATKGVRLEVIPDALGIQEDIDPAASAPVGAGGPWAEAAFNIGTERLQELAGQPFWKLKRTIDILLSLVLIVLSLPLLLLGALLVAIDLGFPIVFWQKRPGLGGREMKIFKLRTMAASHDRQGRRIPDARRVSAIGRFLRQCRLDELPQLFSILKGEMSFVGPRPLLPVDQPLKYRARLLVRPGLTGWAQVQGGRVISADDKAALDVWYIENASLWLDLKVVILTAFVVLFGERPNKVSIKRAWSDLRTSGIYGETANRSESVHQADSKISIDASPGAERSRAA